MKINRIMNGYSVARKSMPKGATAFSVGQGLKYDATNGVLVSITATDAPDYVCECSVETSDTEVYVHKASKDIEYAAQLGAATTLKIGAVTQFHTDFINVAGAADSTAANNKIRITGLDGAAAGNTVYFVID